MKSPFVICGATGNVGHRIAEALLSAGEPVRAIARERVRLGPLAEKGAEPWPGDLEDAAFLGKAFSGARGAFVMIPPKHNPPDLRGYQNRVGASIVSALSMGHVPRIITLSSIGAHLPQGTGPILGLHDLEEKVNKLANAGVVHLRAAYFMENHLWSIPSIRAQGVCGSSIRPDVPIPMVATKDIAEEAARLFLDGSIAGHSIRYLLGPGDLTMSGATRILGEAIGNPGLKYVQFPEDGVRETMAAMGMSRSVIEALIEMQRGFSAGKIHPTQARNMENTTATTLEEFAHAVFARAYRAAA
jgi:uncharacterized protein YbjT (DUF2867 family)